MHREERWVDKGAYVQKYIVEARSLLALAIPVVIAQIGRAHV